MTIKHLFLCCTLAAAGLASAAGKEDKITVSERIDQLIEANYAKHGVKPNPMSSDEVFLRRIYLDVIGRTPTREEAVRFLDDKRENKRAVLVDELLASPGYVSHFYNYWADLLRAKTQLSGTGNSHAAGGAYRDWIRQALVENKPYDQMVRELLTASGSTWNNGAVGFYLRDFGMPLDNLAVTSQLFLGTQIVCAQCHNHPFDTWTQMDYYHLSAFTYGMMTSNQTQNARDAQALYRQDPTSTVDTRQDLSRAFSEILKPVRYNNVVETTRPLRLPHDYQYTDAQPKSLVKPAVPFGPAPNPEAKPIDAFAEWMTSPENPRFTQVIVNRLWKKTMGLGLIEPVDDIRADTVASNPPLLTFLERRMVNVGYDMKKFLRGIYLSKTYQRESSPREVALGEAYHFPGPILRRMHAEQIWDSLMGMIIDDVDTPNATAELNRKEVLARAEWVAAGVYDLSPEELMAVGLEIAEVQRGLADELQKAQENLAAAKESKDIQKIREAYAESGKSRGKLADAISQVVYRRGLSQKATLVAANQTESNPDFLQELAEVMKTKQSLLEAVPAEGEAVEEDSMTGGKRKRKDAYDSGRYISQLVRASLAPEREAIEAARETRMVEERKAWSVETATDKEAYRAFNQVRDGFMRASDLPSPAPNGHFLREFGQSDRELIDNANDQAAITQALALLNGRLSNALLMKYARLGRDLQDLDAGERLDTIYLTLMSRHPDARERELLLPIMKDEGMAGADRVVWTLLNTRQFLFIQ